MRISEEYVLRNIAGDKVVVPTGDAGQHFNGLITMNEVAEFIWESVEKAESREKIVEWILKEFDVDEETAVKDVNGFLDMLRTQGILLED